MYCDGAPCLVIKIRGGWSPTLLYTPRLTYKDYFAWLKFSGWKEVIRKAWGPIIASHPPNQPQSGRHVVSWAKECLHDEDMNLADCDEVNYDERDGIGDV